MRSARTRRATCRSSPDASPIPDATRCRSWRRRATSCGQDRRPRSSGPRRARCSTSGMPTASAATSSRRPPTSSPSSPCAARIWASTRSIPSACSTTMRARPAMRSPRRRRALQSEGPNMKQFDHVLVTGGAGYVGSRLVPQLLDAGYRVTVYDLMYYGSAHLGQHHNLRIVKGDIRDTAHLAATFSGCDAVIHLACISNDASFELDEALSRTVNYECFEPMVAAAKQAGVRRFVYASSSSVYGVSDKPNVTEDHPLVPLTLYNKYKGLCEPLLFKHQSEKFVCVTVRPATVCGYAPRLRLDLSVNILTNHAVANRKILVFGGSQMRPNLHVQDMCELYLLMLEAPDHLIAGEIFNVGYYNMRIADIAGAAKQIVERQFADGPPIAIETTPSNDLRSYHINSDKIARVLGYRAKRSVGDAIEDLCDAFRRDLIPD